MSSKRKTRAELMAALNAAMRQVSGQGVIFSQAVTERLGINATDLECLDPILTRGPLTAGALAEATGLTTGAITGVIDRLERAGFARREPDARDRRKVLVRATPAVETRIAPLFAPMEKASVAVLSRYRDEELAFLLDFLNHAYASAVKVTAELKSAPRDQQPKTRRSRAKKHAE